MNTQTIESWIFFGQIRDPLARTPLSKHKKLHLNVVQVVMKMREDIY